MRLYKLQNTIQGYAWGSPTAFTEVFGIPNPAGKPMAELWMGAHPKAPSMAQRPEGSIGLNALISEAPAACLGEAAVRRFGPALPFLFKALAAGKPLSIQAHPMKRKAERGFDREELAGIPMDAPERNYRDRNHKPETAIALTRFEALCGFRPIPEIIENIRIIAPREYPRFVSRLESKPGRIELSVFFYSLISSPPELRKRMLALEIPRIKRLLAAGSVPKDRVEAFTWVLRLAELYPDDISVFTPLIFNHLALEPGQAVSIGPGEPHAYLSGTALEIMANSDNVIRGGLTEKHVDLPELISVLSFDSGRPALSLPVSLDESEAVYPSIAADFAISRIKVDGRLERRAQGPEILLVLCGELELENEGGSIRLLRGESAFIRADAGLYSLRGQAELARAFLPNPS